MKTRIPGTILAALLLLSTFHLQLSTLFAQGTAFTYQGQLKDGPGPANGSYDLTFSLFGVSSGGSAVGGPVIHLATPVTDGLFTVSLDFGTGKFTGLARWLEIGARTNGSGSFATLTPRQPLTPTPYATYAASARTGGGSPWLLNGTNTFYDGGRVGIGTTTPSTSLHIATAADPIMVLQDTALPQHKQAISDSGTPPRPKPVGSALVRWGVHTLPSRTNASAEALSCRRAPAAEVSSCRRAPATSASAPSRRELNWKCMAT